MENGYKNARAFIPFPIQRRLPCRFPAYAHAEAGFFLSTLTLMLEEDWV
jgi:hypothetical protein